MWKKINAIVNGWPIRIRYFEIWVDLYAMIQWGKLNFKVDCFRLILHWASQCQIVNKITKQNESVLVIFESNWTQKTFCEKADWHLHFNLTTKYILLIFFPGKNDEFLVASSLNPISWCTPHCKGIGTYFEPRNLKKVFMTSTAASRVT